MITESLMIFLTTVMSLNTPAEQASVKKSNEKAHYETVNTTVKKGGGWDLN